MQLREHPVFGRKVFFLNPPFNIRKLVIPVLEEREYEICLIDDYRDAKNILRHYPDSICFVSIDNNEQPQLTINQWFNFVESFSEDTVLSTIYTGVLAYRVPQSKKNLFLLNTAIPAGFTQTNGSIEDLIETLTDILDINGAKGRRKYVRVKCTSARLANVTCPLGKKSYALPIVNISSVGLACSASLEYRTVFAENTLLRDIAIALNGTLITCSAAVFSVTERKDSLLIVLLFLKGTPHAAKKLIRRYIFQSLHEEIVNKIQKEPQDMTEYSKEISLRHTDILSGKTADTEPASDAEDSSQTITTLF